MSCRECSCFGVLLLLGKLGLRSPDISRAAAPVSGTPAGTWPHPRVTAVAADAGWVGSVMPVMGLLPRRTRVGAERPELVGNLTVPTRIMTQGRRP